MTKMTSSSHLVLKLYTQTLKIEKRWPSIFSRSILFDPSKSCFLLILSIVSKLEPKKFGALCQNLKSKAFVVKLLKNIRQGSTKG